MRWRASLLWFALLAVALTPLPLLSLWGELMPAVSFIISAEDSECIASSECMGRLYQRLERELYQRHPQCAAVRYFQRPGFEGGRPVVTLIVRCVELRQTAV